MNLDPELRQNPVSGDWVLVVPGRQKRPHNFAAKDAQKPVPKSQCPFEDPQKSNGVDPLAWYSKEGRVDGPIKKNWAVQVIPNKFPLVTHHQGVCPTPVPHGIHRKMDANGFHELVIPRGHSTFLSDMRAEEAELVIRAYQDRILHHTKEDCLKYVLVFHNHGSAAGASIWHPHSQILALPIIPHDVYRSLYGSKKHFEKNKKCIHCEIISYEQNEHERLIYRNKEFIVMTPFAPHTSFEIRIFPLRHNSRFETISREERLYFADALVGALRRLKKVLKNPAYNFFIHTAPVDGENHEYYHWHLEIFPKTSHLAGLEHGTGIRAVEMLPETAAEYLRKAQ